MLVTSIFRSRTAGMVTQFSLPAEKSWIQCRDFAAATMRRVAVADDGLGAAHGGRGLSLVAHADEFHARGVGLQGRNNRGRFGAHDDASRLAPARVVAYRRCDFPAGPALR